MLTVKQIPELFNFLDKCELEQFFVEASDGITLDIVEGEYLKVTLIENSATITYGKRAEIFRGLSLIEQNITGSFYQEENKPCFKTLSLMITACKGTLNDATFKRTVRHLAMLGYNQIQLYLEENFCIESQPYFGHLKDRYTVEQLKCMDSYCQKFGIELVPTIQTLAHLKNLFFWGAYRNLRDTDDILLCLNEKTYDLIDKIFYTMSVSFTTKNINIGFDEAANLGRGKFADENGYIPKQEIIVKHLQRVHQIAKKYGFKCSMWGDMLVPFEFTDTPQDKKHPFYERYSELIPDDISIINWNYVRTDIKDYDYLIALFKRLGKELHFAGGIWDWNGYGTHNAWGLKRTIPGLISAHKNNIATYILTSWGSNGNHAPMYTALPHIVAAAEYCYTQNTENKNLARRTKSVFDLNYSDLFLFDAINPVLDDFDDVSTSGFYILFNDPLLGVYNYHVDGSYSSHYRMYAKKLKNASLKNPKYLYLFELASSLCNFLHYKTELTLLLSSGYREKNTAILSSVNSTILPKAIKALKLFTEKFRNFWYIENNPHGLIIGQQRLGALLERLKETKRRLNAYLTDGVALPELENPALPVTPDTPLCAYQNKYEYINSPFTLWK